MGEHVERLCGETMVMTIWTCLLVLGMSAAEPPQNLDSFEFSSDQAAARQWRAFPHPDAPLVTVAADGTRSVTQLTAPFATHPDWERVYIDRELELDLAAAGQFELQLVTTAPEAAARLTLYFRSGQGWYGTGIALSDSGWNRLRFSKASFSIEGQPVGWHQIDGIRIAVWRGKTVDHAIRLRGLRAIQNDVAIILPSPDARGESRAAYQTAELVAGMLAELGLGSDAIEAQAVAGGALGNRRVAILAYTPALSPAAVTALVQYVERGGKLFACYQLPHPLAEALGFSRLAHRRQQHQGQFAEVRFHDTQIAELPSTMRQASWNITSAQPDRYNARVIGTWYDSSGEPTNEPALLVSDRGAFFSHILLPDDRTAKQRLLAAVLGHLAPDLWKQMASAAVESCARIGHLPDWPAVTGYLAESPNGAVAEQLDAAQTVDSQARESMDASDYPAVVRLAGRAREHLVQAYLLAQPSRSKETRACWNHSGTGAYPGHWERTARELSEAGFNMVIPNMLWAGRAHYASDVLPRSRTFDQYGDQIKQCVAACGKYGLEVHVWKVNWNLSGAPEDFVRMIHKQGRNQVAVDGQPHDWLCPSHPENQQLELASMIEVVQNYDVDGLHFDYIRYPDRTKCYCEGCRERFEKQRGAPVTRWPHDCYSGALRSEYAQWRCDQITNLVRAVHRRVKMVKPDVRISAAVFGAYPSCRESVAQDWPQWITAGYLDFVCPMDYTQSDEQFAQLVRNQLKLVGLRIPLYPGIGQWRLAADRTVGQIHIARELGADGFTMFDLTPESIRTAVPAIGLGVGTVTAKPAHRR